MRELGRMMVFAGAALAAVGALVWLAARRGGFPLRLGRLPGDIAVPGKTWLVLFPRGDVYPAERGADADPVAGAMAEKVKQFELNLAPERKIWSVAELTARISGVLASQFSNLWVEGEVSNYRPAQSGHLYFTLKDAKAQVQLRVFSHAGDAAEIPARGRIEADRARIDQRVRAARRISDLRRAHRAVRSRRAAARVRAAQEAPRRRRTFRRSAQEAAAHAAAAHRRRDVAQGRGRARHYSHPAAAISESAPDRLSRARAGRRRGGRNRRGAEIFQSQADRWT